MPDNIKITESDIKPVTGEQESLVDSLDSFSYDSDSGDDFSRSPSPVTLSNSDEEEFLDADASINIKDALTTDSKLNSFFILVENSVKNKLSRKGEQYYGLRGGFKVFKAKVKALDWLVDAFPVENQNDIAFDALEDTWQNNSGMFEREKTYATQDEYLVGYLISKYEMLGEDARKIVKEIGRNSFMNANLIPNAIAMKKKIASMDPELMQELEEVYAINESWDNEFLLLKNLHRLSKIPSMRVKYEEKDLKEIWRESLLKEDKEVGKNIKVESKDFFLRSQDVEHKVSWRIKNKKDIDSGKIKVYKEPVYADYADVPSETQALIDQVKKINPEFGLILNQAYVDSENLDLYTKSLTKIVETHKQIRSNPAFKAKVEALVQLAKAFPIKDGAMCLLALTKSLETNAQYNSIAAPQSVYFKEYLIASKTMNPNQASKYVEQLDKNSLALSRVMEFEHRIGVEEKDPLYLSELRDVYLKSGKLIEYIDVMQSIQMVSSVLPIEPRGGFSHYFTVPEKFWNKIPCLAVKKNGQLSPISAAAAKREYVVAYDTDQFYNFAEENGTGVMLADMLFVRASKARDPEVYKKSYSAPALKTEQQVDEYIAKNAKGSELAHTDINFEFKASPLAHDCERIIMQKINTFGLLTEASEGEKRFIKNDILFRLEEFEKIVSKEAMMEVLVQLKEIPVDDSIFNQQEALLELWDACGVLGDYPFEKVELNQYTAGFEVTELSAISIWDKVISAIHSAVTFVKNIFVSSDKNTVIKFEDPLFEEGEEKLPEIRNVEIAKSSDTLASTKSAAVERDDSVVDLEAEVTADKTFGSK